MRKVNKRRRLRRLVFLFCCFVVLVIGSIFAFYSFNLKAVGDGKKKISFEIKEGESFDQVVDHLKEKKVIRSAAVSKVYAKFNDTGTYYAGNFTLNDGMSTKEVFAYLANPENSKQNQIVLTIPEGKWAKEIASSLHDKFPKYTVSQFENKWNDISYIKKLAKDYTFLDVNTLNNSNYKIKLEGYLFPDTYSFDEDATIDEITRTFLNRFQEVYNKYASDIKKSGYSLQEILSLASVVQYEASSISDMEKIAGVFYNRLDQGMRLDSSVTVCYALYDDLENATDCEVQTDIDSPYNTYLNQGIPIGPILNPGSDAIKAVLHPTKSDYLYFLADINGDGTVYYSKTLEEHEEKMKEYGLVLDEFEE